MKEIIFRKLGDGAYPYTIEDQQKWSEFHENQPVRAKVYGIQKPRSVDQLRLFWACCRTVADNTEDVQWNTSGKVCFQVKVALNFFDPDVVAVKKDGTIVFNYRSISFAALPHMEACRFFDRAYELLAAKIGITVDELKGNTG